MTKLPALLRLYTADRAEVERHATPPAQTPPQTCRYCGGSRKYAVGVHLDGHTKCYVSDQFKDLLYDAIRTAPSLSFRAVGKAFGVPLATVRAWYTSAAKIRRAA